MPIFVVTDTTAKVVLLMGLSPKARRDGAAGPGGLGRRDKTATARWAGQEDQSSRRGLRPIQEPVRAVRRESAAPPLSGLPWKAQRVLPRSPVHIDLIREVCARDIGPASSCGQTSDW